MNSRLVFVLAVGLVGALTYVLHLRGDVAVAAAPDGKMLFASKCAACHQASGLGGGPYPPLAGNADVTAPDTANLILTVLNGRSGPIQVNGKTFSGAMPAWKDQISTEDIAAVLTYIRSAWTNKAAVVTTQQVAAARNPTALRGGQVFRGQCAACRP